VTIKMPTSMKVPVMVGLLGAFTLVAGCADQPKRQAGEYRTISAAPRRDTDAAKRANQDGLKHMAAGNLEQAERAFNRALTADVEFGPAHNNLGKLYYKQQNWYKAAWEFEYASELMPRHAEPRNNLGLVLEEAGELDRAVDHYREAVGLDPDSNEYRANLARALIRRGDRTDEVHTLLKYMLEHETRPKWLLWAKRHEATFNKQ